MPTLRLSTSSPEGIIARLHCPNQKGEIDLGRYCTEEFARDDSDGLNRPNEKSMSVQVYTSGSKEICCSLSLFHLLRSKRDKAGTDDFEYTAKVFIDTVHNGKVRLTAKEVKDCEHYIVTPVRRLKADKGTYEVWIEEMKMSPWHRGGPAVTMIYKFRYVYFVYPTHYKTQVDNAKSHAMYDRVPTRAWKLWERDSITYKNGLAPIFNQSAIVALQDTEVEDDNDEIVTPPLPSWGKKGRPDDVISSAAVYPSERSAGRETLHEYDAILPPAKPVIESGHARLLPTGTHNVDNISTHSLPGNLPDPKMATPLITEHLCPSPPRNDEAMKLGFHSEKNLGLPLLPKEEQDDNQIALDIAMAHNPLDECLLPCKKISAVNLKKRPREEEALLARHNFKEYHSKRLNHEDDIAISRANQEMWKMKIAGELSRRGHQFEIELEQQYMSMFTSPYIAIQSTMQQTRLPIDDAASRLAITPWGRGSRNAAHQQQPRITEVSQQAGPYFGPLPPGGNLQSRSALQAPIQRQAQFTTPPSKMRHYRQWRK